MAKKKLNLTFKPALKQMLEAAQKDHAGKSTVAFIGKTFYGKTVVSTLLFDAIFNSFYPKNKNKINVRPLQGFDKLVRAHKRMLKGRFPPPTLPGTRSKIIIELASKSHLGPKIELILRDASGEDLISVLQKEYYDDLQVLLENVLTEGKISSEPYGPLSYLIFAEMYVILIDCEDYKYWKSEQFRFVQVIKAIKDLKGIIGETNKYKKFQTPIAIIFTKYDKLKEDVENYKKIKILSTQELLEKEIPALESSLNSSHDGKINYFNMSINGVEEAIGEEATKIAQEEIEELAQEIEESGIKSKQIAEFAREKKIEERVKHAREKAKKTALDAGQPEETAEQQAQQAAKEERKLAEEGYKIDDTFSEKNTILENLKKMNKQYYKIKTPLKYSIRQYLKFISWIMEVMTE